MSEKIIGLVKDISQFIIGTVVSETDQAVTLKNAAILGISNNGPQINIQFIPLDILTLQPPLGIRDLIKDRFSPLEVTFKKDDLLFYNLDLSDNVIANYQNFVGNAFPGMGQPPPMGNPAPNNPDQNIIKLFDTPTA